MEKSMGNSDTVLPVRSSDVIDTGYSQKQSTTPSDDNRPREAILYIGPLDIGSAAGKTIDGVVTRLRDACEKQSRTGSSKWRVEWRSGAVTKSDDSSSPKTNHVATILRKDDEEETPEFDIFEYAWAAYLTESWERQNIIVRIFRTILALLHVGTFIRFFKLSPSRAEKGRLQLVLAIGVIVVVALYSVFLMWAAILAVFQFDNLPIIGDATAMMTIPQWIMIAMTTLGIPAFSKLRNSISLIGSGLLSASAYLRTTDQRGILMHGLSEQAERFRDKDRYQSVTLISYSFGSILAIDALFPKEHPPELAFENVKKLVTIGSAYDFVKATAPQYFKDRHAAPGVPERWINVYAPIDLLGSSFTKSIKKPRKAYITVAKMEEVKGQKKKKNVKQPIENIRYDNGMRMSFRNALEFYGFTSHGAYWGTDDTPDRNVFMLVVPKLYPEENGHLR